jgi:hypothetical protein
MHRCDASRGQRELGAVDLIHIEQLKAKRCADDVHDGVRRANLVEGNLLGCGAMDGSLGFGEPEKGGARAGKDAVGQSGCGQQCFDLAKAAESLGCSDVDLEARASDAVVAYFLSGERIVRQWEGGEPGTQSIECEPGIEQGAEHHIATDA